MLAIRTMHHAAAMRFIQCVSDLSAQFQHLVEGQYALFKRPCQRFSLDALHHQVVDPET